MIYTKVVDCSALRLGNYVWSYQEAYVPDEYRLIHKLLIDLYKEIGNDIFLRESIDKIFEQASKQDKKNQWYAIGVGVGYWLLRMNLPIPISYIDYIIRGIDDEFRYCDEFEDSYRRYSILSEFKHKLKYLYPLEK